VIYAGRHLFQRVILLGGSALSPWAISRDTVDHSLALADRLNCSTAMADSSRPQLGTPDRALVVQCLRRLDVQRLVEAASRRPTSARESADVWTSAAEFGPTLGRVGSGVLPGSRVQQLIDVACDNRLQNGDSNSWPM